MNNKIFIAVVVILSGLWAAAVEADFEGGLKFTRNGRVILKETGLSKVSFSGNPATAAAPYVKASRKVEKTSDGYRISVDAQFDTLDFWPEYAMHIPAEALKDAKLTVIGVAKRARVKIAVPAGDKWTLKDVVFLTVENNNGKFALGFEWTGIMAFQHYRDEAWAANLERTPAGLNIRLIRRYPANIGGLFTARVTVRTRETDFTKLHGTFQAHYKKNLPVVRFFAFRPVRQRPFALGGVVTRDDDIKLVTKRFSKAVLIPVTRGIPNKFGGGGWNAGKYLKYSANRSESPILSHAAVGGRRKHDFTMKLPDGYYFLTFHVRDDAVKTPKNYQVEVNGRRRTIPVYGARPSATRWIVKVVGGELKIDFIRTKKMWHVSAISAIWLGGIGDMSPEIENMKEFQL